VAVMLGLSYILGSRSKNIPGSAPYESGIKITGSARLRFPAKFYLIAMFFVLFDIETVFIITWAIAFREVGWAGYLGLLIFVVILLIILLYEWRSGALEIEQNGEKILKALSELKTKDNEVVAK
jgi:NADH-quinone oxidoreductase subunit A